MVNEFILKKITITIKVEDLEEKEEGANIVFNNVPSCTAEKVITKILDGYKEDKPDG